jgi:hypothetical protein
VRMDSLVLFLLFSKKPLPHITWVDYAPAAYARAEYPADLGLPPVDAIEIDLLHLLTPLQAELLEKDILT